VASAEPQKARPRLVDLSDKLQPRSPASFPSVITSPPTRPPHSLTDHSSLNTGPLSPPPFFSATMVQPAHHVPRPQKIQLPAIPPSQLPQYVAPTRASKALQFSSFALAGCITAYAVLAYDFGPGEHCFMPVSEAHPLRLPNWAARQLHAEPPSRLPSELQNRV